jgi:uncharacterized protein (TIGR03083 family)
MDKPLEGLPPIFTAALFPELEAMLVELLRSLSPEDWEKQTLAPQWKVKDVAAHLLDTQLRKLSAVRDGYSGEAVAIPSDEELIAFINRLNAEGVRVYRRLSPEVLIALMQMASAELCAYVASLDPFAAAKHAVSWAGEQSSANWFDTAREFTERWHHQQQIRLAVDRPGIMTREFYFPVLDCFMRALPFAYRDVPGRPGTFAQFNISGDCGGSWYLYRANDKWQLVAKPCGEKVSETTIPQEIAWRIFTKGMDRDSARAQVRVTGDSAIGLHILEMVAIVG